MSSAVLSQLFCTLPTIKISICVVFLIFIISTTLFIFGRDKSSCRGFVCTPANTVNILSGNFSNTDNVAKLAFSPVLVEYIVALDSSQETILSGMFRWPSFENLRSAILFLHWWSLRIFQKDVIPPSTLRNYIQDWWIVGSTFIALTLVLRFHCELFEWRKGESSGEIHARLLYNDIKLALNTFLNICKILIFRATHRWNMIEGIDDRACTESIQEHVILFQSFVE